MRVVLELGFERDPNDDELEYVALEALATGSPPVGPTGCDFGFEAGAVVIDPGGPPARIVDTLRYGVAGCLRSVPALVEGGTYTYPYFDHLGEVQFVADGERVRISGRYVHPVVCPRAPLLEAFVAAGVQYVTLMPRILPGYEDYLETVQRVLPPAREALGHR